MFKSRFQLHEKAWVPVWFPGFFAFPDYSSFCPKSRERRGQKVPPVQKKAPQKAPPGPVWPRKAGEDTNWGLDPQTRRKPPKAKILGFFKACF